MTTYQCFLSIEDCPFKLPQITFRANTSITSQLASEHYGIALANVGLNGKTKDLAVKTYTGEEFYSFPPEPDDLVTTTSKTHIDVIDPLGYVTLRVKEDQIRDKFSCKRDTDSAECEDFVRNSQHLCNAENIQLHISPERYTFFDFTVNFEGDKGATYVSCSMFTTERVPLKK